MSEAKPSHDPRWLFQVALNTAMTTGAVCDGTVGLGPNTTSALTAVATSHPDASVDEIADAYSAFDLEHGDTALSE